MIAFLHVLGACLFIGNIMVSGFWKTFADRTRDTATMRFACRLVNLTDLVFTGGGAALLLITGHLLAQNHGGVLAKDWILAGYALFGLSGALWALFLVPIQLQQLRLLREASVPAPALAKYFRLSRWWSVIGVVATALPVPAIYLMLAKPV